VADTTVSLYESLAGNINFVGTQKTRRTNSNTVDPCSVLAANTTNNASLSGIPASATIVKAYLYWAGSGTTGDSATWDYDVNFEGAAVSAAANRRYTSEVSTTRTFFSGVADVTTAVNAKRNGSYSFSGLSVVTSGDHCNIETVLSGWALVAIYSDSSEDFRIINLYEGFQNFINDSITLTPSNFRIPASPINGKHAHVTWEGDDSINDASEDLIFNGSHLSDATNPLHQQFNSKSTITGTADNNSYGVDFDTYNISAYLTAGATSATTTYSSGGDRVLLSAEIISNTNTPVADLGITMGYSGTMEPGQTVTYTLNVSNNGPNTETGPITVTNTPPAALTYTGASGSGWVCNAPYTTCTRAGNLASGAATGAITLTATVNTGASGTITNTAAVAGTLFDNVASNDTASDSRVVQAADLSLLMARDGPLVAGANVAYTLTVGNGGPLTHSGTVTVVDTLPSGLTYSSATGTGWSCGSVGQTVTCTSSTAINSGASAAALTINAAVSAGASGTLTNSATVTGTILDTNSANNTATDSGTVVANGCTTTTVGGDTLVTCTGNGTVTIPSSVTSVRYLVVGGGGGGGGIVSGNAEGAGGGGAGGVLSGTSFPVTAGPYPVTVGSGGTAGTGSANGGNGISSTFSTLTAVGGGGGAWAGNTTGTSGSNGASGGGGSDGNNGGNASQGNDGGSGNGNDGGGGGGGAGAAGANGTSSTGGNGGAGVSNDIAGTSKDYGGGGGGGTDDGTSGTGGSGGLGGGGSAPSARGAGTAGTVNTGGGGGGASGSNSSSGSAFTGGTGGSGIVIIRYPTAGTPTCSTYLDQFSSVSYSRNDGSQNWAGNWIETNDDGSPSNGYISVVSTSLQLTGGGSLPRIEREANLSALTSATLTFDYSQSGTESSDTLVVEVSNNGGTSWTTIQTILGGGSSQAFSTDVSTYISSNFRVRLTVDANRTNDKFSVDNVQIEGCVTLSSVDHYAISYPNGNPGVTCEAQKVRITGHTSADVATAPTAGTQITLSTTPAAGGWANVSTNPGTFTAPNNYTFNGTETYAEFWLTQTTPTTAPHIDIDVTGGARTDKDGDASEDAKAEFTSAAFKYYACTGAVPATCSEVSINHQIAAKASSITPNAQNLYLRAVRSDPANQCTAALNNAQTVKFAYECINPVTCHNLDELLSINGGTATYIARNDAGAVSVGTGTYSDVSMNFGATGYAPFNLNYGDVGKIKLHALKIVPANSATTPPTLAYTLYEASNEFVVKPYGFTVTNIKCTTANTTYCGAGALLMATSGNNPGATDASSMMPSPNDTIGMTFIRAGDAFSATVSAVRYDSAVAFSFGRESTPEDATLAHSLISPTGGTAGTLGGTTSIPGASFQGTTKGVATVTDLNWSEVGIIALSARLANDGLYLGAGVTTTGSIAVGSNSLLVSSTSGIAIGTTLTILGAGTNGKPLMTTVTAVSGTTITLAAAAQTTVTGDVVVDMAGATDNIGRFVPHHFGVTGSVVNRSDLATPGGSFTYMGEPMKLTLEVTAYNKSEGPTQNYTGNFAKLSAAGTPSLGTTRANWVCTSGTQCMGLAAVSGSDLTSRLDIDTTSTNSAVPTNTTTAGGATVGWGAGKSYFTLFSVFNRAATPDGPYATLKFGVKPLDSDGVTLPPKGAIDISHCSDLDVTAGAENSACTFTVAEAQLRRKIFNTALRFGRLRLVNAYGSELLPMRVEGRMEYWDGGRWTLNTPDSLTSVVQNGVTASGGISANTCFLSNPPPSGPTNSSCLAGGSPATTFSSGTAYWYVFDKTPRQVGYADLTLATPAWLDGWWSSAATGHTEDPVARIRFGSPKAPYIYLRERY
jgi:uncharacterized repeat protein (TIGR01451 family)